MVGRSIDQQFPKQPTTPGATLLEVRDVWTRELLRGVSLVVRRGEIVGLAGLVGAGRTELARGIFGADPIERGAILLDGQPVSIHNPGDAVQLGMGFLTEDRKKSGLILNFALFRNHTLPSVSKFVTSRPVERLEVEAFAHWATELSIRARSPYQPAHDLSGGNQQKVVIGKWLERNPRLLILDEPTRGVDVGAKVEIYEIMNRTHPAAGTAILMISSDLPEVMGMSDRIVVMHEGGVTGEFARAAATRKRSSGSNRMSEHAADEGKPSAVPQPADSETFDPRASMPRSLLRTVLDRSLEYGLLIGFILLCALLTLRLTGLPHAHQPIQCRPPGVSRGDPGVRTDLRHPLRWDRPVGRVCARSDWRRHGHADGTEWRPCRDTCWPAGGSGAGRTQRSVRDSRASCALHRDSGHAGHRTRAHLHLHPGITDPSGPASIQRVRPGHRGRRCRW